MKSRIVRAEAQNSGRRFLELMALLVTSLLLAACASTTEPGRLISITPASPTFALQSTPHGPELKVDVTLTNTSASPIYYSACAVKLERKADGVIAVSSDGTSAAGDGVWFTVWSPMCAAVLQATPPTLNPGESVTIPIEAAVSSGASVPHFEGTPGLYRAVFTLETKVAGFARQLSEAESTSDPFTVTAN